jgi:DNA-binding NarL/FixJ family response regulator
MSIRVLIADDQALIRSGLRNVLSAEEGMEVVGEAVDGADAVGKVERLEPDVVVMDVKMPRLDGIEATRQIATSGRARVVMLTTFGLEEYVYESLRAGATGFVLKDASPEDVVAAIRTAAAGSSMLSPEITRLLIEQFVSAGPKRDPGPEYDELTRREREVLRLLTNGLSNAEIARKLVLSEPTVKTHVAQVLRKLGVRDRVQAVIYAYEAGLVDRESAPAEGG